MDFVNISEAEASARERLPYPVYCYYAGGAHDEITLAENRRASRCHQLLRWRS